MRAWIENITHVALQERGPSPILTDELYTLFFKTGKRLPFETVYFERRRRLGRVAAAVLVGAPENRQGLIDSLVSKVEETMSESSWTFPAHVWLEPSGKDPLMIDLFAAETANLMAEIISVFSEVLPISLIQRIRERLRVQYFENYLLKHESFAWTSLPMNWNAVCHQGVLGAALTIETDHELLTEILSIASRGLPLFLDGFGADGSTSEGPGYWSYGFGRFAELNAQLEARTEGRLSLFDGNPKISKIACFAPALAFTNGCLVNFSDGNRKGRLPAGLLAYLGDRLNLPDLRNQSSEEYHYLAKEGLNLHEQRADFFHYSRLFLRGLNVSSSLEAGHRRAKDVFFPDYGALVARGMDSDGNLWEFAGKAGHNDEHHNHNDCGSFLLNINGTPTIIEIGAPEYIQGYFSDERYEHLAASSRGHSVPLINGCPQAPGREFSATVIDCNIGSEVVEFVLDLSRCYPKQARCEKLERKFFWQKKEGLLTLTDSFELAEPGVFESILIFNLPWQQRGEEFHLKLTEGLFVVIGFKDKYNLKIESCSYRNHEGDDENIFRLSIGTLGGAATGKIECSIRVEC